MKYIAGASAMDYRTRIYTTYASKFQHASSVFDVAAATRWSLPYQVYLRGWLPDDRQAQIVDLACGNGRLLHFFKLRGYAAVRGVDVSLEQVQLSRQVVPDVHEASALDYLEQHASAFDLITAIDLIEHLNKDEVLRFLDACIAALRPGGRVILQTPNADSPFVNGIRYGDFTHESCFNGNSLGSLLGLAGFEHVEARELGPVLRGSSLGSSVRFLLWQALRSGLKLWNLVETGASGSGIFTRVFLISGTKPGHVAALPRN